MTNCSNCAKEWVMDISSTMYILSGRWSRLGSSAEEISRAPHEPHQIHKNNERGRDLGGGGDRRPGRGCPGAGRLGCLAVRHVAGPGARRAGVELRKIFAKGSAGTQ